MPSAATLAEALAPLRAEPGRSAVLLDIDGTLAPIVRHAEDARVPEATRAVLIRIARAFGLVACVSGRRAAVARQIVSLGTITYVGNHGSECLRAGRTQVEVDREAAAYQRRVHAFAEGAFDTELRRLRVRLEDKEAIAALHWRGVPDEEGAQGAVEDVARMAEDAGFTTHWGRKVLEIRPPVRIDKGAGVVSLLRDAGMATAVYVGDDRTDLDAFRGLGELVAEGRLRTAVRVGVASGEEPAELREAADHMVEGTDGVRELLTALLR